VVRQVTPLLPIVLRAGRPSPLREAAAPFGPVGTGVLLAAVTVLVAGVTFAGPVAGPAGVLLVALGGAVAALVFGSPTAAILILLFASFLRLAVPVHGLPAEPMVLVLAGLVVSTVLAGLRGKLRLHFGALEMAMVAYLLWNIVSAVLPHDYPPVEPSSGAPIVVYRFILTGTVLPFVAYVVGRSALRSERAVRPVLITVVALAGWSALLSIMQFTGPNALVWPRYIVDAPNWSDRAVGIFNQPVVNGLVMVAGFVTATFMAQDRALARWPRITCALVAVLCVLGIYLTRTRAVWLVFGVGVLVCAVFARGARTGFVVTLTAAALFVGVNWSTFTSSDRAAGGVGSANEVEDRLNTIATSVWAIEQKPLTGWGIARFEEVNTYHHQQWDPTVSYERGYSIPSHENELGIAAELGLPGLAVWLTVLGLMLWQLFVALRKLPVRGLGGRPFGLLALTVLGVWVVCGFTVDLRYFDFANLLVFLLVGAAVGLANAQPPPAREPSRRPGLPRPRQLAGVSS
jgi:O-antigen ligase